MNLDRKVGQASRLPSAEGAPRPGCLVARTGETPVLLCSSRRGARGWLAFFTTLLTGKRCVPEWFPTIFPSDTDCTGSRQSRQRTSAVAQAFRGCVHAVE